MRKVLIANRGEIAIRVARACRDAGLASVAVYGQPDLDALHVRAADEAYALGGVSAGESYLDVAKILKAAAASGADAVHPGYGFLAENAHFAREVIAAGLTWIGPPPAAIEALGDKTAARVIARSVGAPLAPGTQGPVSGPAEAARFADEHGLPIAIKAAYGGGGRGLKVARTHDEIEAQFESAVREAVAAFGRGECFVERYLDRPRHVETQCLADSHGNIVVVSTRDCSLQRRHQKLVEEAPAPFLTGEQETVLRESSKAILREAAYVGAGTCEFLIGQDGTVSFLEVNTRLQVEHPVTEEVSGIDLVLEMFKIADGQALSFGDPDLRGHSIEFRINAEDPGRNFLPAPGTLTAWNPPSGPGVRLDAGYAAGMTVPQMFDSLIAKLIVTGAGRPQALARARRALAEFEIGGMPTVLPFHRALLDDPAFTSAPFAVHTRWIETEFSGKLPPYAGDDESGLAGAIGGAGAGDDPAAGRERIVVEVGGKRLEVIVPARLGLSGGASGVAGPGGSGPGGAGPGGPGRGAGGRPGRKSGRGRGTSGRGAGNGDVLVSPMQGTIVKIVAADGQRVAAGDTVVVLEAMKMEQPLTAHKDGTVSDLGVEVGQTVSAGHVICRLAD
ncbi:MAG TPA: biotin carboxylase N-terminal domain-containing protein [Streptosporangiaceae bacterium]|nr:biotin carboxylase N-terminal domain-containing protein [Streptosporangiaceae bacterium]